MPTSDGPCRFGQYAPYLRRILDDNGYQAAQVLSPTSRNGYEGLGDLAKPFFRTQWRSLVAADILQKLLLLFRPHEDNKGESDTRLQSVPRRPRRDHRAKFHRARAATEGDARGAWCAAASGSAPFAAAATRRSADRRRRRNLLPPEHVLQRRPGAPHRGVRRRVLGLGHHRMGLVHELRAVPEAAAQRQAVLRWTASRLGSRTRCSGATSTS